MVHCIILSCPSCKCNFADYF